MILFDGAQFAYQHEAALAQAVLKVRAEGKYPQIAAVLFGEDTGSQLYTQLKKQAAERVGIGYQVFEFSMSVTVETLLSKLRELNADPSITGIIIQKPRQSRWEEVTGQMGQFRAWWLSLVTQIAVTKDVDGLHPETLAAVERGTWRQEHRVLPATARAVLYILTDAQHHVTTLSPQHSKVVIIGRSDILGKPLFYELQHQGWTVELIGRKELSARRESGQLLLDADVVISASGQPGLITGELLKDGVVVIDVGEPKPDVDQASVQTKAAFLTPVPGGVGPVTVVCLLENSLKLLG